MCFSETEKPTNCYEIILYVQTIGVIAPIQVYMNYSQEFKCTARLKNKWFYVDIHECRSISMSVNGKNM